MIRVIHDGQLFPAVEEDRRGFRQIIEDKTIEH